jgi:hypothetical protein
MCCGFAARVAARTAAGADRSMSGIRSCVSVKYEATATSNAAVAQCVQASAQKVITLGFEDSGYNMVMKGLCYSATGELYITSL